MDKEDYMQHLLEFKINASTQLFLFGQFQYDLFWNEQADLRRILELNLVPEKHYDRSYDEDASNIGKQEKMIQGLNRMISRMEKWKELSRKIDSILKDMDHVVCSYLLFMCRKSDFIDIFK